MEQNGEQDESQVGPPDQFPREAIEESDLIGDDGRWARLLAEGARAVCNVIVTIKFAVRGHSILARLSLRAEVNTFSWIVRLLLERDDAETVRSAIVPEEVEEGDRAAHGGCRDE